MTQLAKCAFCGKEPKTFIDGESVYCLDDKCFSNAITRQYWHVASWNAYQPIAAAFILDRERKAFEAGQSSVEWEEDSLVIPHDAFEYWQRRKERGEG